jgi:hypothetical protein
VSNDDSRDRRGASPLTSQYAATITSAQSGGLMNSTHRRPVL